MADCFRTAASPCIILFHGTKWKHSTFTLSRISLNGSSFCQARGIHKKMRSWNFLSKGGTSASASFHSGEKWPRGHFEVGWFTSALTEIYVGQHRFIRQKCLFEAAQLFSFKSPNLQKAILYRRQCSLSQRDSLKSCFWKLWLWIVVLLARLLCGFFLLLWWKEDF